MWSDECMITYAEAHIYPTKFLQCSCNSDPHPAPTSCTLALMSTLALAPIMYLPMTLPTTLTMTMTLTPALFKENAYECSANFREDPTEDVPV